MTKLDFLLSRITERLRVPFYPCAEISVLFLELMVYFNELAIYFIRG